MKVLDIPSSGSVNWRTASRNRNGQYIRNRSIPVQPRSSAQLAMRGFMTLASQSWKELLGDHQTAWKTFGSLHPRTDSLGQSNGLTGQQAFVSVAATNQLLGDAIPTGAPPQDPDFSAFREGTIDSTDGVTTITGYTPPQGGRVMIWASKPASTGRRFFGAPLYLQSSDVDATADIDITTQLALRWGTPPNGSVIQITQIPVTNGITGSKQVTQFTFNAGLQLPQPVLSTNFTITAGTGDINFTVVIMAVPLGVTHWQFEWKLTTDSVWQTTEPLIGSSSPPNYTGVVANSLASGSYSARMRWFSGTVYGLPGVWSDAVTGITIS